MSTLNPPASTELAPSLSGEGQAARARLLWQPIAIAGLLLLSQVPLLNKFFADLWSREEYQFFPIAILAAAYLAWDRLREIPLTEPPRTSLRSTAPVLLIAWVALCGGLLYLRLMGAVSTWLVLAAMVWWVGGWRLLKALLPAGILLLVIIPPPGHLEDMIGTRLRLFAVRASCHILDILSIQNYAYGSVIDIPGHQLLIEEACSGINSLMSVIAFSLLYGLWQRKRPLVVAMLTAIGIGFVLCANIVRITFGAVLVHYWKIDILSGTPHALLGMVLFAMSATVLVSFDRLLILLGISHVAHQAPTTDRPARDTFRKLLGLASRGGVPGAATWWTAAVAFFVLGIAMQVRVGHAWTRSRVGDSAVFSMPARIGDWKRMDDQAAAMGHPETDSIKSKFWLYRNGNLTAAVAMAYPFDGFHDATICYRSSGWDIRESAQFATPDAPQGGLFRVRMTRFPLARALLYFGLTDEQGRTVPPQPPVPAGAGRLQTSMQLSRQKALASPSYGVQVLSVAFQPTTPEQEARLRSLFMAARKELAGQVVKQVEGGR